MSDTDQSAVRQFLLYCALQLSVCFGIHTACRLVQNHNTAVLQKSTAKSQKLLLSGTIVGSLETMVRQPCIPRLDAGTFYLHR